MTKIFSEHAQTQRYTIEKEIIQGGASTIYKAYDHVLLRHVVMKVLDPRAHEYPEEMERFREEAQVTAQLEHPNIVPVYDWYIDPDDQLSFIMKFVRGGTLRDCLQEQTYDPSSEVDLYRFLQIFLKVCEALSFAHSKGVVHRDLKPENIMIGPHGQVYLMDWGILRLVHPEKLALPDLIHSDKIEIRVERDPQHLELDRPGMVLGSLFYLSPEQAHGVQEKINETTDVFALGAILYEILTQEPPYFAWTPEEFVQKAQRCEIVPPQEKTPHVHLPAELCSIVMKAMAKEQSERYSSVDLLRQDVERFLLGGGRFAKQTFSPGELIIKEGDEGHVAFMIVRGYCDVFKIIDGKKVSVAQMGPGDVFGETAVFVSGVRTANVSAIDDVTVKVLDRQTLEQDVGFDSWITKLIRALALRFVKIDRVATQLRQDLASAKLVQALLVLLLQQGERISAQQTALPWSVVSATLAHLFAHTPDEILTMLSRQPGLSVDLVTDRIILQGEITLASLAEP